MKKIPTLFERIYEDHKIVGITPKVTPGMEWVLNGEGIATVKWDGACCAIINGEFYKRYDAKNGKKPPDGAIPCCDPDPITGHWPHWIKCEYENPADKWFWAAHYKAFQISFTHFGIVPPDGTYEAVGKHFNGNPYEMDIDVLVRHGCSIIDVPRSFKGIRDFLQAHFIEGIVFWNDKQPQCKIKRSDFGFDWGTKTMSDELIRKSEMLHLLNELGGCGADDEYFKGWDKAIDGVYKEVENIQPVNAVELPCKVGDKLYIVYDDSVSVEEKECVGFWVTSRWVQIQLPYDETFTMWNGAEAYFGKTIFLTREEAEKALEDLKNENK